MNNEANKGKEGRNGTRKISLIKSSKKENLIEKILKHEVQKRKKENEPAVNQNAQEKDFSLNQSKIESTSNPPVNAREEKKNLTDGKKKILRQLEAQSILERIKREVITKHLDNLGAESRKRSPTTRDLNIHKSQPIQNMLEQEVSSRVIPISSGDAFLRNMSKSPEANKSKSPTSKVPSSNNSQTLNLVSIRIPSKEDRELHNINADGQNPSSLIPYQFQTSSYNHFKIDNLDSVRFKKSTHEALYKTNSEIMAKRFIQNGKQDNKLRKEVKFQFETFYSQSQDGMEKENQESKAKVDLQIKMLKRDMENNNESMEFDLIADVNPQKYAKDTIVVSAAKNIANNTVVVGDQNDSRFLRKKVFYEIYGKFSNRLSDFLLKKHKPSSRRASQTKKEEKSQDINERMKKNKKRSKFNEDVSENILNYRNIFKNQRSPDNTKQKIVPDESFNSTNKFAINTLKSNLESSNNTIIFPKENHDPPFKKIVSRGGVIPFRSTPTRLREKEVFVPKKFHKHDIMKVPQRVMENAAKFIQVVWREHYKIKRDASIKIQSVLRGSQLRAKVRSVIYDYFLLQNKIINLEKLIIQKFYKEFMSEFIEINKIEVINRKKTLKCIILIQKTFKKYYYKKYPTRQRFILARQSCIFFAKSEKIITTETPEKEKEVTEKKQILDRVKADVNSKVFSLIQINKVAYFSKEYKLNATESSKSEEKVDKIKLIEQYSEKESFNILASKYKRPIRFNKGNTNILIKKSNKTNWIKTIIKLQRITKTFVKKNKEKPIEIIPVIEIATIASKSNEIKSEEIAKEEDIVEYDSYKIIQPKFIQNEFKLFYLVKEYIEGVFDNLENVQRKSEDEMELNLDPEKDKPEEENNEEESDNFIRNQRQKAIISRRDDAESPVRYRKISFFVSFTKNIKNVGGKIIKNIQRNYKSYSKKKHWSVSTLNTVNPIIMSNSSKPSIIEEDQIIINSSISDSKKNKQAPNKIKYDTVSKNNQNHLNHIMSIKEEENSKDPMEIIEEFRGSILEQTENDRPSDNNEFVTQEREKELVEDKVRTVEKIKSENEDPETQILTNLEETNKLNKHELYISIEENIKVSDNLEKKKLLLNIEADSKEESVSKLELAKKFLILSENNFNFDIISITNKLPEKHIDTDRKKTDEDNYVRRNESFQTRNLNLSNYSTNFTEIYKEDRRYPDKNERYSMQNLESINYLPIKHDSRYESKPFDKKEIKYELAINYFDVLILKEQKEKEKDLVELYKEIKIDENSEFQREQRDAKLDEYSLSIINQEPISSDNKKKLEREIFTQTEISETPEKEILTKEDKNETIVNFEKITGDFSILKEEVGYKIPEIIKRPTELSGLFVVSKIPQIDIFNEEKKEQKLFILPESSQGFSIMKQNIDSMQNDFETEEKLIQSESQHPQNEILTNKENKEFKFYNLTETVSQDFSILKSILNLSPNEIGKYTESISINDIYKDTKGKFEDDLTVSLPEEIYTSKTQILEIRPKSLEQSSSTFSILMETKDSISDKKEFLIKFKKNPNNIFMTKFIRIKNLIKIIDLENEENSVSKNEMETVKENKKEIKIDDINYENNNKNFRFKNSNQNVILTKTNIHPVFKRILKIQRFIKLNLRKNKRDINRKPISIKEKENEVSQSSTSFIIPHKLSTNELSKIDHSQNVSSTMFITRVYDYSIINETNPTQNDTKDVNLNINMDSLIQHETSKPILLDVSDSKLIEIREEKEFSSAIIQKHTINIIQLFSKVFKKPNTNEIIKIQNKWREYSAKSYLNNLNTEINVMDSASDNNVKNTDLNTKSESEHVQDHLLITKLYQKSSSANIYKKENLDLIEKLVRHIQMKRRNKNYKSEGIQITINRSVDFLEPLNLEKANLKGPFRYRKILSNTFATKEYLSRSLEDPVNSYIFNKATNINITNTQEEIKSIRNLIIPILNSNINFTKELKHFNNKNILKIQNYWKRNYANKNHKTHSEIQKGEAPNFKQDQSAVPMVKKVLTPLIITKEIKDSILSNVEQIERKRDLHKVRRLSKSQDYDNESISKFKNITYTIKMFSTTVYFTKNNKRSFKKSIELIQRRWREFRKDMKAIPLEPFVEIIQKSLNSSAQDNYDLNIPNMTQLDNVEFNDSNDNSTLVARKYIKYLVDKIVHIKKNFETLTNNLKDKQQIEAVHKGESPIMIKKIFAPCHFTKENENNSSYKMLYHIQKIWRHYNLDKYSAVIKRKRAKTVCDYNYQILHSEGNILFSEPIKLKKNASKINYFTKEIKFVNEIPDLQIYWKNSQNNYGGQNIPVDDLKEVVKLVHSVEKKNEETAIIRKLKKINSKTVYIKDYKSNFIKSIIFIQKIWKKQVSKIILRNATIEHHKQNNNIGNFTFEINTQTGYPIERELKESFINSFVFNYEAVKSMNIRKQPTLFNYITKDYKFQVDRKIEEVQNSWKQHKTSKKEHKYVSNELMDMHITGSRSKEITLAKVISSEIELTQNFEQSKVHHFKINQSIPAMNKASKRTDNKKIVKIQRKLKSYLHKKFRIFNDDVSDKTNGKESSLKITKPTEIQSVNYDVPIVELKLSQDIFNRPQHESKKEEKNLPLTKATVASPLSIKKILPLSLTKTNKNITTKKIIEIQRIWRKSKREIRSFPHDSNEYDINRKYHVSKLSTGFDFKSPNIHVIKKVESPRINSEVDKSDYQKKIVSQENLTNPDEMKSKSENLSKDSERLIVKPTLSSLLLSKKNKLVSSSLKKIQNKWRRYHKTKNIKSLKESFKDLQSRAETFMNEFPITSQVNSYIIKPNVDDALSKLIMNKTCYFSKHSKVKVYRKLALIQRNIRNLVNRKLKDEKNLHNMRRSKLTHIIIKKNKTDVLTLLNFFRKFTPNSTLIKKDASANFIDAKEEKKIECNNNRLSNDNDEFRSIELVNQIIEDTFDKVEKNENLEKESKSLHDEQNNSTVICQITQDPAEKEIIKNDNKIEIGEDKNKEVEISDKDSNITNLLSEEKNENRLLQYKDAKSLLKEESKLLLKSEEFSISIPHAPKDELNKLIKTFNNITKRDTLRDIREYQLDHMGKELFAYLINKKRLNDILASLQLTNFRIRSLDLIYRLITSFKNAAGRFIFDNLKLNNTSNLPTDKNKHMIELMHKQLTMNYMNAVQELYKTKMESLNKNKESKIEEDDQELNVNIQPHDPRPNLKMPYKRNVYSYGWYQKIEPRPIPFHSEDIIEEKTIAEPSQDVIFEEELSSNVPPSKNLKTKYLIDTLKRGHGSSQN